MTNKPMLSVDLRALLERLLSHDFAEECQECGIGYSDAWSELRALLDNPVVESEFEPDAVCMESDGCPTEVAVLKRFWRENQPDTALCRFYEAEDYQTLAKELVGHVAQLQDAAKRNVKPWEDTFPPTLLPAYIARINAEQPAPVSVVMPERKPQDLSRDDQPMADWFEEVGYNKALDDVARLNGVKP